MIIFDLTCSSGHTFEGWFRSADDFESQSRKSLIACPHCGATEVRRLPSAVHVATRHTAAAPMEAAGTSASATSMTSMDPTTGRALLKMLADGIAAASEDVGYRFAEEARRIHYQEAEARPIRGKASEGECAALEEEGIDFLRMPEYQPKDFN